MRVAVVGAGWAGISAAIEATHRGHHVTLYEMAGQLGGRARTVVRGDTPFDNGQHILIGAYAATLAVMRRVGVDPQAVLARSPLRLVGPDGRGLCLPPGRPALAFVRAVLARPGWGWQDRASLLGHALRWASARFTCPPGMSVRQLCEGLTANVMRELVEPLCVAALNTPVDAACGAVFLRVLRDAVFGGPGSADLLLPRENLGALLPEPGRRWLESHGARVRLNRRVDAVVAEGARWWIGDEAFQAVVLACSANEAARLASPTSAHWAARAGALAYEPIMTVYARCEGCSLPQPMLFLSPQAGQDSPAQFVFDLGQLGRQSGLLAFVISAAQPWVERGVSETVAATLAQARRALGASLSGSLQECATITEKRATFACAPGLDRPPPVIGRNLLAAGDYVSGPYPATLEGAVRSGVAAIGRIDEGTPAASVAAGDAPRFMGAPAVARTALPAARR